MEIWMPLLSLWFAYLPCFLHGLSYSYIQENQYLFKAWAATVCQLPVRGTTSKDFSPQRVLKILGSSTLQMKKPKLRGKKWLEQKQSCFVVKGPEFWLPDECSGLLTHLGCSEAAERAPTSENVGWPLLGSEVPGRKKEGGKSLVWERTRKNRTIWSTRLKVRPGSWNCLPVGSKKSWGWEKVSPGAGLLGGNWLAELRTRVKITVPSSTPGHHPRNSHVTTTLLERTKIIWE